MGWSAYRVDISKYDDKGEDNILNKDFINDSNSPISVGSSCADVLPTTSQVLKGGLEYTSS